MRIDVVSVSVRATRCHSADCAPLDINEEKVVAAAEQFIALGLRDAGYEYINIDVSRDSSGFDLVMLNFTGLLVGTRTKRHWLYCSRL